MSENITIQTVHKSIDEDKRLFTAIVLRPDVVDAHGDIYSKEVVEKACHDYNANCRQGNLQHLIDTNAVVPVESSIAKSSYKLGEGEVIEGDWVMTMKINHDEIWKACKEGLFTGLSVGARATIVMLEDEES